MSSTVHGKGEPVSVLEGVALEQGLRLWLIVFCDGVSLYICVHNLLRILLSRQELSSAPIRIEIWIENYFDSATRQCSKTKLANRSIDWYSFWGSNNSSWISVIWPAPLPSFPRWEQEMDKVVLNGQTLRRQPIFDLSAEIFAHLCCHIPHVLEKCQKPSPWILSRNPKDNSFHGRQAAFQSSQSIFSFV